MRCSQVGWLASFSCRRMFLAFVICWITAGNPASAAPTDVMRVEEEWELVLLDPAPAINAPQVTCVISPRSDLSSLYAVLELNQQTFPVYVPGGLQLQVWSGQTPVAQKQLSESKVLATAQEMITWRTAMEVRGSTVLFQVVAGTSTTWGNFGETDQLTMVVTPASITPIQNLNGYTAELSTAKSFIGFASNRVRSLVLTKVRVTNAAGDVFEDATRRPVFENSEANSQ